METKNLIREVEGYIRSTDRLTQFWRAAKIAQLALQRVDDLQKAMHEIVDNKSKGYAGKVAIKRIAEKVLNKEY